MHVESIEVRCLKLMYEVRHLDVRVYWPFQGVASFVDDPFLLFQFHVSYCDAVLSVHCGLMVACCSRTGRGGLSCEI